MARKPKYYNSLWNTGLLRYVDYSARDKETNIRNYVSYFLVRLLSMFKYDGLPETMGQRELETYLLVNGYAFVTDKYNGKDLFAYYGGIGDGLNEYYFPKKIIVNNPWQNFNKTMTIGEDGVLIRNDALLLGVLPLLTKYATLLVENELTINLQNITSRLQALISVTDDDDKKAIDKFFIDLESGKLGSVATDDIFEGIKSSPLSGGGSPVTQLIELEQYLKASLWNEIGLKANHNMKREALNDTETSMNDMTLLPLIDQMLEERKRGVDAINKMYGTNITVSLNSAWEVQEDEVNALDDEDEKEDIEDIEDGGGDDDE